MFYRYVLYSFGWSDLGIGGGRGRCVCCYHPPSSLGPDCRAGHRHTETSAGQVVTRVSSEDHNTATSPRIFM